MLENGNDPDNGFVAVAICFFIDRWWDYRHILSCYFMHLYALLFRETKLVRGSHLQLVNLILTVDQLTFFCLLASNFQTPFNKAQLILRLSIPPTLLTIFFLNCLSLSKRVSHLYNWRVWRDMCLWSYHLVIIKEIIIFEIFMKFSSFAVLYWRNITKFYCFDYFYGHFWIFEIVYFIWTLFLSLLCQNSNLIYSNSNKFVISWKYLKWIKNL